VGIGKGLDKLAVFGLYLALIKMSDEDMIVQMSANQIRLRLDISRGKIAQMMKELERRNLITVFGACHSSQSYRQMRVNIIPLKGMDILLSEQGSPLNGQQLIPHAPMVLHEKKKREIVADEPRQSAADKPRRSLDDNSKKKEIYESEHWRMLWDMYPHRADLDDYEQANCVAWLAANLERVGGWKGPYFDRILDYINRKPDDFPAHKLSKLLRDDKIKPLEAWPNP